eukprot:1276212-Rhodomonas_salina.4
MSIAHVTHPSARFHEGEERFGMSEGERTYAPAVRLFPRCAAYATYCAVRCSALRWHTVRCGRH